MSRVKLKLPKKFVFSTEIQIRINDINYGGHLGNDSLLSLIHEARVRFLNKHGFTELNIDGLGFIMIDSVIVYKTEVFYGENLRIDVTVDCFDKHGFDFYYKITKVESNREAARAKTGIVFFDYETKKIAKVPNKFKSLFTSKSK